MKWNKEVRAVHCRVEFIPIRLSAGCEAKMNNIIIWARGRESCINMNGVEEDEKSKWEDDDDDVCACKRLTV